ncbi:hypothetical protein FRC11_014063, partial [Ceratobasidium sp. 423]
NTASHLDDARESWIEFGNFSFRTTTALQKQFLLGSARERSMALPIFPELGERTYSAQGAPGASRTHEIP